MDGNHHANRFVKNSDPRDTSLLEQTAHGYFPPKVDYTTYLKAIPNAKEVMNSAFPLWR
jgi:hypothetical protein